MAERRVFRLAPEYGCWPLWDDATGDNLEPEHWPLPPDLAARLRAWDDAFQATLDSAYPPDSRFASAEAEAAWTAEGAALKAALIELLGAGNLRSRL